jgi:hypothetical protein
MVRRHAVEAIESFCLPFATGPGGQTDRRTRGGRHPRDNSLVFYILSDSGASAGGASLYAVDGDLRYEYSALLLKPDKITAGKLPAGKVKIELEMHTPMARAAPTELTFWSNGKEAATGTVQRSVPLTFTASETFDVGLDTCSPVADDYFEMARFTFEGRLKRLYFTNLEAEQP